MNEYITKATEIVAQVFDMAPAPFTMLLVLALGYFLRLVRRFPNEWIPAACIVAAMVVFPVLNERAPTMPVARFLVRAVSTGLVIGVATWLLHDKFLSQIEDRIPFLKNLLARVDNPPAPDQPTENKPTETKP